MTKSQMAKYNRISTKCHAYVRTFLPEIYDALAKQVENEWSKKQFRRVSKHDLERALNIKNSSEEATLNSLSENEQNQSFDSYWEQYGSKPVENG